MQAISRFAACAVLISNCALAEPPGGPSGAASTPALHPPAPPELAPLSQDFQAAMANSQLQTYRYGQLTEQAMALKKLCETGFGPADICPSGNAAAGGNVGASGQGDLPTVSEIDGASGALRAVLTFPDGRRITVRPGSRLPGDVIVAAITGDDVQLRSHAGAETVLLFGDRGGAK